MVEVREKVGERGVYQPSFQLFLYVFSALMTPNVRKSLKTDDDGTLSQINQTNDRRKR